MEQLSFLLKRDVIIGLAIVGATIATVGSFLLKRNSSLPKTYARYVLWFGYGLTWGSVALFIVAGFATAYGVSPG